MLTFTSASIAGIVALALALIFEYTPVLAGYWDKLLADQKRGLMILFLLVSTGALLYKDCALLTACYADNWQSALLLFLEAVAVNQTVYAALPRKESLVTFARRFTNKRTL